MIIVSQDKDEIINFDNITSIVVNDVWDDKPGQVLTATDVRGSRHSLGYYKNEKRAKEVLQEIYKFYEIAKRFECSSNYGVTIFTEPRFAYSMPEE